MEIAKPYQNLKGIDSAKAHKLDQKSQDELSKSKSDVSKAGLSSSKVNMSERAIQMQKAKSIASQVDVDETKVARLQKMIDDGSYKVDAASVADRLVDEHLKTQG